MPLGTSDNMMYVVGASNVNAIKRIRLLCPDHFLLIPGVGAQGGDLSDVCKSGFNKECGVIVNLSRSIIYSDNPEMETIKIQKEMSELLKTKLFENAC
jgi:orotidine-5'-phosphate decarboxylase